MLDAGGPVSLTPVRLLLCRAKKVVQLPDYHFVDHRIEIKSHDTDYNKVICMNTPKLILGCQSRESKGLTKSNDDNNKKKTSFSTERQFLEFSVLYFQFKNLFLSFSRS